MPNEPMTDERLHMVSRNDYSAFVEIRRLRQEKKELEELRDGLMSNIECQQGEIERLKKAIDPDDMNEMTIDDLVALAEDAMKTNPKLVEDNERLKTKADTDTAWILGLQVQVQRQAKAAEKFKSKIAAIAEDERIDRGGQAFRLRFAVKAFDDALAKLEVE